MIWFIAIIGLLLIPTTTLAIAVWSQPDWIVRLLFTAFCGIPFAMFLTELRFVLPIGWRRNAKWDAFLCRIGSHRCVRECRSGCCWRCLRCEPKGAK